MFQLRVWCRTCEGDEQGCFEGTTTVLEQTFETREAADAYGNQWVGGAPYEFEVITLGEGG